MQIYMPGLMVLNAGLSLVHLWWLNCFPTSLYRHLHIGCNGSIAAALCGKMSTSLRKRSYRGHWVFVTAEVMLAKDVGKEALVRNLHWTNVLYWNHPTRGKGLGVQPAWNQFIISFITCLKKTYTQFRLKPTTIQFETKWWQEVGV